MSNSNGKTTSTNKKSMDINVIEQDQQFLLDFFSTGKRGILRTVFGFYRGHYRDLLLAALFFFIKISPEWIIPLITANVIDIATTRPDNAVLLLIINGSVVAVSLILNFFTNMLYISFLSKAQRGIEAALRGAMVRKLQQLSITFHKEFQSGKIQSKVMRDVESIESFTKQLFTTCMAAVINMVVALFIVLTRSLTVFFMFLVCVPFTVIVQKLFKNKLATTNNEFRKEIEKTSSDVLEMEELITVTRAHSLEKEEIKKMTKSVTSVAEKGYRVDMTTALFGTFNWVIMTATKLGCLFFTGVLALRGVISVGDVTLYQGYFSSLTSHVNSIISILPIITKGAESIKSIGEILGSHDIEDNDGKIKLKKLDGKYEFRDVYFEYDGQTPVLNGLNLTVNPGETIALVGGSGSGKSTILNLVIGFNRADSGTVLIDGIDVKELDMRSCRKFISVVPQNSILFSGSIKDNITYGCPRITQEVLDHAVRAARLDDVIAKLPNGIDTQVGEHGAKLSGGQRQRISIARAIIRDPRVIIFDEATSALDSVTEKEIQQAIDNLTENRTTFIVAHRLSTIRNADKIAVIREGRCVEYGTYDELMANKKEFYKLKQMQV